MRPSPGALMTWDGVLFQREVRVMPWLKVQSVQRVCCVFLLVVASLWARFWCRFSSVAPLCCCCGSCAFLQQHLRLPSLRTLCFRSICAAPQQHLCLPLATSDVRLSRGSRGCCASHRCRTGLTGSPRTGPVRRGDQVSLLHPGGLPLAGRAGGWREWRVSGLGVRAVLLTLARD